MQVKVKYTECPDIQVIPDPRVTIQFQDGLTILALVNQEVQVFITLTPEYNSAYVVVIVCQVLRPAEITQRFVDNPNGPGIEKLINSILELSL